MWGSCVRAVSLPHAATFFAITLVHTAAPITTGQETLVASAVAVAASTELCVSDWNCSFNGVVSTIACCLKMFMTFNHAVVTLPTLCC
jgi:hypothetical protein